MRIEWLNNGQPHPPGHAKAGQLGIVIDFEDGREHPQRVWAPDAVAMVEKTLRMYGNTATRLRDIKAAMPSPTTPATPPAPAAQPAAPTGRRRLTAEERMQYTADLEDPAKAAAAIVALANDETGVDLAQQGRQTAEEREIARLQQAVADFIEDHPEYEANARNGKLVRDRALADFGVITAETLAKSFASLQEDGVLNSAQPTHQPAADPAEPSAPTPARSSGATSVRPSQFGGARPVNGKPETIDYDWVLANAGTHEYERRLREEPGFKEMVNRVCEPYVTR